MTAIEEITYSADAALWASEVHHLSLDPWQVEALHDRSPRMLLNVSRQAGKTLVMGIMAAHLATFAPRSLSLVVCPSWRQSQESFLVSRSLLGVRTTAFSLTRCETEIGSRIIALPAAEETVRGYSAVDLLAFDEASRVPDSVFIACRPMLAVSGGREILSSTPAGCRGVFWQEWRKGEGWKRYEVRADDCPRIPKAFLAEERRRLGPLFFSQEYQNQFVADHSSVWDRETIESLFVNLPSDRVPV